MKAVMEQEIASLVDEQRGGLIELLADLVRIPSENRAPYGAEEQCQHYIAGVLRSAGWEPVLYTPLDAPGIEHHPMFWSGRHYTGRPNIGAVRRCTGGGRSLVLSGHIDTVPAGSAPWTRLPFGGAV
jgi:acetylornithine deacetylase